jgi:hypothetical protein
VTLKAKPGQRYEVKPIWETYVRRASPSRRVSLLACIRDNRGPCLKATRAVATIS